ncbi:S8 family serine peptidase [Glaciecola petra]|uniref:S8 family serine peptidase n=1 Tax=Glaciecola petra TaxID=3075602 RepID=A0ABU2ZNY8_9ALTE|nr:S8 family serine peptidase [Aestuariibacter sp. P117]MDT0594346.1 S8 family serine peptidase [Aestuariibacter sp. P117]
MKLVAAAVITALYGSNLVVAKSEQISKKVDGELNPPLSEFVPAINKEEQATVDQRRNKRSPELVKFTLNSDKKSLSSPNKFTFEAGLGDAKYTYIVELNEQALAQNTESLRILNLRHGHDQDIDTRFTDSTPALNQHRQKIRKQKTSFYADAEKVLGKVDPLASFEYALNGLALKLTQNEAQQLANLTQVKSITREQTFRLNTDRGPTLVGAPAVWDGSALANIAPSQGEGIIVGIIDSGINTDHPSFAEQAADGYVHTNPLGNGVFIGDCANGFPELCNNKLIGVRSYSRITDDYSDTDVFPPNLPRNGEDYGGHGSHVASTAAGNVLLNVAEVTPEFGEQESAGVPTGFSFPQISGVAPRANIISYQVCYGGRTDAGDTYGDCPGAAIIQGIEDAIRDQVDIINFSISGGGNPWNSNTEQAFLSARNAGIFVATSAGNSGPNPGSTVKNAPWYTSVAAAEHGRENVFAKEINSFSGGSSSLSAITGQSNTGNISAPIVYAGDFTNPNDPNGDPAQCLQAFPAGTFNGQIVVCDRGEIARIAKAENVRDGGAGGYVLANVDGGDTFLANDQYVVPGIHINAENGNRLKSWLDSGSNHRATITTGNATQVVDESRVDVLANFSSRGPNETNSTLAPTLTGPGVDIYAAYADQQFGHDGHEPAASDFNFLSGTSMSSPHVAGSAALIKSVHPSWSPDEIRSALSLTATSTVQTDVGTDPENGDFFDKGAGRINVDLAVASGLVMSESGTNYTRANPAIGGDPRSLNIPSITDDECAGTCTWTRTFTATTDATWTASTAIITNGLAINISPSSFTLNEGQTQTVSFEIESARAPKTEYSFASVSFSSPGLPDATLPISVFASIGDIPLALEFDSSRQIDSLLQADIEAINLPNFFVSGYMPVKATVVDGQVSEDSDNSDLFDNLNDGVQITTIQVPSNAVRLVTEIKSSTAPDLDLFLIYDANSDGVASRSEVIGESLSSDSTEEVSLNFPDAGTYFIAVQSFTGSSATSDSYDMRYAVVENTLSEDELVAIAPTSIDADTPFDLRVIHNLPDSTSGDDYYGAIAMGTASGLDDLGVITVDINRKDDDVFLTGAAQRLVEAGDTASLAVNVGPNTTSEARNYRIIVPLPVGTDFGNFSAAFNGQIINNELVWEVNKAPQESSTDILSFDLTMLAGANPGPVPVVAQSELVNQTFSELENSQPFEQVQIEGAPELSFNGNDSITLNVVETQLLTIPLSINEPNGDNTTVVWTQTMGPAASIIEANGSFQLTAPNVEADAVLNYDVVVTDSNNNASSASITVNVDNNAEPVISSIDAPTSANGGQRITLTINVTDPENDNLTITVNGETITGNTFSTTTPTTGSSVSYQVLVSDGISTVSQTVSVNLTQTQVSNPPASSGGGGGTAPILTALLLPLIFIRRYFR